MLVINTELETIVSGADKGRVIEFNLPTFGKILRITAKKTTCYHSKNPPITTQNESAALGRPLIHFHDLQLTSDLINITLTPHRFA